MSSGMNWPKYAFFTRAEVCEENVDKLLGSTPTCGIAEGGQLIFGDGQGFVYMSDRLGAGGAAGSGSSARLSESNGGSGPSRHRLFTGSVTALAYLHDYLNPSKQFLVAIGTDIVAANSGPGQDRYVDDRQRGVNASAASVSSSMMPVVKVFSSQELSASSNSSTALRRPLQSFAAGGLAAHIPGGMAAMTVTAFAVLPDGSQVAVGFSTGVVLVFLAGSAPGNSGASTFLKETNTRGSVPLPVPPQQMLPAQGRPVSSVHFCELPSLPSRPADRRIHLFVVLDTSFPAAAVASQPGHGHGDDQAGIIVMDCSVTVTPAGLSPSLSRRAIHTLDDQGASALCAGYMSETRELVVGRPEGVFSYSSEDRGGAAGLDGSKVCVRPVGRYVLIAGSGPNAGAANKVTVTVYDLRNKFIGGSLQLPSDTTVRMVLSDGGTVYVLSSGGYLQRMRERETTAKLQVLVGKMMFPLAITLAAEEQCDVLEIVKLHERYAEHLLKKSDFDGAVAQYCHTIGFVPPSSVVRLFLEPARLPQLLTYLECLHTKGVATKDHTTMLLTCLAKLKDESRLVKFLDTDRKLLYAYPPDSGTGNGITQGPAQGNEFDAARAVQILADAGYTDHAFRLALRHRRHAQCVQLQMSRRPPDVVGALALVTALLADLQGQGSSDAADAAAEQASAEVRDIVLGSGPALIAASPQPFVGWLVRLCVCDYTALLQQTGSSTGQRSGDRSNSHVYAHTPPITPEAALRLFHNNRPLLHQFVEGVFECLRAQGRTCPAKICAVLLELHLAEYSRLAQSVSNNTALDDQATNDDDEYDRSGRQAAAAALGDKIMSLLDCETARYEPSQALLLTSAHGFAAGSCYLLEQMGHTTELLIRLRIEAADERGLFKLLRREGRKDPELYIQVLRYFVDKAGRQGNDPATASGGDEDREEQEDDDDRWDSVMEVLRLAEEETTLAPMQILSALSSSPELPLHVAASFVRLLLTEGYRDLQRLRGEVEHMRGNIEAVQQEQVARAQLGTLSRNRNRTGPGGRFVSSKHQSLGRSRNRGKDGSSGDVGDNEYGDEDEDGQEDPEELMERAEQNKWKDILRGLVERSQNDHEAFFAELEQSTDGFSTVAANFGKRLVA